MDRLRTHLRHTVSVGHLVVDGLLALATGRRRRRERVHHRAPGKCGASTPATTARRQLRQPGDHGNDTQTVTWQVDRGNNAARGRDVRRPSPASSEVPYWT